MSIININNLQIFPLILNNSNILPCIDRCYFTKHFNPITNFKIYKTDNSSIHIDVRNNNSYININVSGNNYKFVLNDIIITFPAIHKFQLEEEQTFFGEILLSFYNNKLKKYSILSVLLDNSINESTTLCSSLFNEINTYLEDLENEKLQEDPNNKTILENNQSYNIEELNGFQLDDLLPNNNSYYTFLNKNILWYIYKNTLNLSNSCSSKLRNIIKNNVSTTNTMPNLDIFLYTDLDNNDDNEKCVINIIQKVDHKYDTNTQEEEEQSTNIDDIDYNPLSNLVSNIILYIINTISITIFIILFVIYNRKNDMNALIKIFIAYCITTIIYSIWYYSININNLPMKIINFIMMSLNLLGIGILFLVYHFYNNITKNKLNLNPLNTEIKSNTNPLNTEIKPITNPLNTEIKPNTSSLNTEIKPITNPLNTKIKPNTIPINTEIKPNTNSLNTEIKPNTTSINTEIKANTNSLNTEIKANTNSLNTEIKANTNSLNTEIKPNTNSLNTEDNMNTLNNIETKAIS